MSASSSAGAGAGAAAAGGAGVGAPSQGKEETEQDQLSRGPFSILMRSVKNNTQVLINLRNNHKLLGRVRAFDRHCNMVLEQVKEVWSEVPPGGKKSRPIPKDRVISKMFLRGAWRPRGGPEIWGSSATPAVGVAPLFPATFFRAMSHSPSPQHCTLPPCSHPR